MSTNTFVSANCMDDPPSELKHSEISRIYLVVAIGLFDHVYL